MRALTNLCSSLHPELDQDSSPRERELAIDASVRFPLLGLIKFAAVWLLFSTLLGLVSSIKLHTPSFLDDVSWLTYGRVRPAFWNALVYGFAFHACLACGAWILARLSGRSIGNGPLLTIAATFWNIGVLLGVFGILAGDQQPYALLEFPAYVAPFLLVAFLGIGIWGVLVFKSRIYRSSYAAQWYLLAALFAFAWIYTVAQTMLFGDPAQGVVQWLVSWWYVDNLLGLVLGSSALAAIYYFLPKCLGCPIVGYRYSGMAFWSWVACHAMRGPAEMLYGPVPAWLPTVGVVFSFGLLLPATTLSIQLLSTLFANFNRIWDTLSLRYIFVGALSFTLYILLEVYSSMGLGKSALQFSLFESGAQLLALLGFVGMTMIGGIYFILPRLLNKRLPVAIVDAQFWLQLFGLLLVVGSLVYGGSQQGELLNASDASLASIAQASKAFLFVVSLGFCFCLAGAVLFAYVYFALLIRDRAEDEASTELFQLAPEMEGQAS